jgi:hypothetical protein
VEADLQQLLSELRAAIERTKEGHEDRAELLRLMEAVERRLQAPHPPEAEKHLADTLREAEVRFESDHPRLGPALRRVIDALSSAGI